MSLFKAQFYIFLGLVALGLVKSSAYIVYQPEQAIVLQFGKPIRLITEAGLKFKVPLIQNVVFYDSRLLNLDPPGFHQFQNTKKSYNNLYFASLSFQQIPERKTFMFHTIGLQVDHFLIQ